ncbi:MAG: hypothetical protein ACOC9Z_08950 [Chloroflexota bacterium]
MDELNLQWLQRAYEELVRAGEEVTTDALLAQMSSYALEYRDRTMEMWWNTTLEHVPAERLRYLYPKVRDLLADMDCYRGGEGEDPAAWVACALAFLRWWKQSCAGRFPEVTATKGEVRSWLAEHAYPVHENPQQPSLFRP